MTISSEHYFLEQDLQFHTVKQFVQWDCRCHSRTVA